VQGPRRPSATSSPTVAVLMAASRLRHRVGPQAQRVGVGGIEAHRRRAALEGGVGAARELGAGRAAGLQRPGQVVRHGAGQGALGAREVHGLGREGEGHAQVSGQAQDVDVDAVLLAQVGGVIAGVDEVEHGHVERARRRSP